MFPFTYALAGAPNEDPIAAATVAATATLPVAPNRNSPRLVGLISSCKVMLTACHVDDTCAIRERVSRKRRRWRISHMRHFV